MANSIKIAFAIVASVVTGGAHMLTPGTPCPTISADKGQKIAPTFVRDVSSGDFRLDSQRGESICGVHKCMVADPGFMLVTTKQIIAYFSVPQGAVVELLLNGGRLSCTIE